MSLIDDRWRIFGRLNVIDAASLMFVAVLVPIGVMGSRVFREAPPPRIDALVPVSQPLGPDRRIHLRGANFRPHLRAFVNPTGEPFSLHARVPESSEARFVVESSSEVELQLPPVTPGSYDLYLYDGGREVVASQSAFTIQRPRLDIIHATVRFVALSAVTTLMATGDTDIDPEGAGRHEPSEHLSGARIESHRPVSDALAVIDAQPLPLGTFGVTGSMRTVEATLAIPATKDAVGVWMYRGHTVGPGDVIEFDTVRYSIRGVVVAVNIDAESRTGA